MYQFVEDIISLPVLCAVAVFTLVFIWMSRRSMDVKKNLPPTVRALPIVGSLPFLGLTGKDDHLRYQELSEKHGNIYCFWLARKFVVVLSGYDVIRTALLDQAVIMAGRPTSEMPTSQYFNPRLLGLITPSYTSKGWKKGRQVSLAILKDFGVGRKIMESGIQKEVDSLIVNIRDHGEKPRDIRHTLTIAVSNVICAVVFGKRYDFSNSDELGEIIALIHKYITVVPKLILTDFFPALTYLPYFKKTKQEVIKCLSSIHRFVERFIIEHEAAHYIGKEDDFIDAFIGRTGEEYDCEQLMYIVRDLFFAGTETTSTTLEWAVIYMANNMDIQKKVQTELEREVGRERSVHLEDKPRLPYTEAVLLEIQRLASLVPNPIPHMTLSDTELCGYHIPKGTMVFTNLWSVLRDPQLWPEPEKFKPERFLDDNGAVVHRSELIPFSLGRRSCLGQGLARQELFLFFCGLMQNFTVRAPETVDKFNEDGSTFSTRIPGTFEVVFEPIP